MTIDERIERDAAQWRHDDHPPSLDDLLDAVTKRRRAPVLGWVTVGAAAVLALALAIAFWPQATHQQPSNHRHLRSTPPITVRALAHVRFAVVVPDAHDPRLISAVVATTFSQCGGASRLRVSHLEETPTAVRIVLAGVSIDDHETHGGCMTSYVAVPVHLREPLGDRTAYDEGKPRPRFDPSQAPTPGYLPAGYQRDVSRDHLLLQDLAMTRVYRGSTKHQYLSVEYAAAVSVFAYIERTGPSIDVNGHQARFEQGSSSCLGWSSGPGVVLKVCGNSHLPNSEVVKVARSLH